jgi:PAS domain S-box-containing protein
MSLSAVISRLFRPTRSEGDRFGEAHDRLAASAATMRKATSAVQEVSGEILKKMERQMAQLRNRLEAISNALYDALLVVTQDGTVQYVNPSACHIFRKSAADIVGKNVLEFMPDFNPAMDAPTSFRESVGQIGNEVRQLEVSASILRETDNTEYIVIIRDITEVRSAQNKVYSQQALQAAMFRASPTAVYYKDINLRYQGCNSEFERLTGRSEAEVLGQSAETAFEAQVPMWSDHVRKDHEAMAHPDRIVSYVASLFNPQLNKTFEVLYRKSAIVDQDGNVVGIVGTALDISDLVQARSALSESIIYSHALSRALDEAADQFVMLNSARQIVFANRAFLVHFHLELDNIRDRQFDYLGITLPEGEEVWRQLKANQMWAGETVDGEHEITAIPIRSSRTEPAYYVFIVKEAHCHVQ